MSMNVKKLVDFCIPYKDETEIFAYVDGVDRLITGVFSTESTKTDGTVSSSLHLNVRTAT